MTKIVRLRDGTTWDRCRSCEQLWSVVGHESNGQCRRCFRNKRPLCPSVQDLKYTLTQIPNDLHHLLLFEETKRQFGYSIESLSHSSSKKIMTSCDVCGQPKQTQIRFVCKGRALSHNRCKKVKSKKTNLERYGVEAPAQSELIREKMRRTTLERHGVEYATQSEEKKEKARQTNVDKYGVSHSSQLKETQEKKRQTNLQKYGVEHPLQIPAVKERALKKARETMLEKHGVENPWFIPEVRRKAKQTMLERYGAESYVQLPENRDGLKQWCINNPEKQFTSRGELDLLKWVNCLYPGAAKHKDANHEIDIYIEQLQLGIEYNGLYWHQESNVGKNYHLQKTNYFESLGIRIIHIFEHEWTKRQQQVKGFLLSALGHNQVKIPARKCELTWSSDRDSIQKAHAFLERHHIQGFSPRTRYVAALSFDGELVAVATFCRHHRNFDNWVLSRFCTKACTTIQGGLSRLSTLAARHLQKELISWADFRLSQGKGYQKAGWVLDKLLPPDYFYHKNGQVFSKQSRQKSKVRTPEGMTELEHAKQDGLSRVYDCGKIRFRFSRSN